MIRDDLPESSFVVAVSLAILFWSNVDSKTLEFFGMIGLLLSRVSIEIKLSQMTESSILYGFTIDKIVHTRTHHKRAQKPINCNPQSWLPKLLLFYLCLFCFVLFSSAKESWLLVKLKFSFPLMEMDFFWMSEMCWFNVFPFLLVLCFASSLSVTYVLSD